MIMPLTRNEVVHLVAGAMDHEYRGGRYRPENALNPQFNTYKEGRCQRGFCVVCNRAKAVHFPKS